VTTEAASITSGHDAHQMALVSRRAPTERGGALRGLVGECELMSSVKPAMGGFGTEGRELKSARLRYAWRGRPGDEHRLGRSRRTNSARGMRR